MHEKYKLLRENFLSIAEPLVNSDTLDQLKRNYAYDINSKRKLSEVRDLRMFIRLLEKRNVISYDNIEQLLYISKTYIGKPDLESKLMNYENWLQITPQSFYDMYQSDDTCVPSRKQKHVIKDAMPISEPYVDHIHSLCNCAQLSTESQIASSNCTAQELHYYPKQERRSNSNDRKKSLQKTVLLQLSERLGRSWRDVSRHLGIRECEIDAVQCKHPYDLKEQSYEILKIYMSQSDSDQWALNLARALEKGRRRDLKELIEELTLNRKDI